MSRHIYNNVDCPCDSCTHARLAAVRVGTGPIGAALSAILNAQTRYGVNTRHFRALERAARAIKREFPDITAPLLTLEEFRATGREVKNLDDILGEGAVGKPGRVYYNNLHITRVRPGRFGLSILHDYAESPHLVELESILYDFYVQVEREKAGRVGVVFNRQGRAVRVSIPPKER